MAMTTGGGDQSPSEVQSPPRPARPRGLEAPRRSRFALRDEAAARASARTAEAAGRLTALGAPESLRALPTTGTSVTGLWVVATESSTRYVIVVPPDGAPRAVRLAYYGYQRGEWRPFRAAYAFPPRNQKCVRVGAEALVQYTPAYRDYYRSTPVVAIDSYPLPALLALEDVEAVAEQAMWDSVARGLALAVRAGRIPDQAALAEICARTPGVTLDVVLALLDDL